MANLRGTSQCYVHRCNPDGPLTAVTFSCAPGWKRWPATLTRPGWCLFCHRLRPVFFGVNRSYAHQLDTELNTCPDCGAGPEEDCAADCPKGLSPDAMRWGPGDQERIRQ